MFSPFGRDASLIGREPEQNRNYWRAAIDICDGKERPEKVNISIDKSKGTITASGELPLSGTTFKKVVSFPNNVRSETIQSTLQGKTLTLSGETDPTKTDGFLSGGFGRGGFSDPFESNASKSFNDMAKNFFGSSWKDFDTSFENQAGLMERPSRLVLFNSFPFSKKFVN
ncbi:Oidioi.mRNA.OKI2018_I69.XSR.g13928.t1.cds [Oikopleura dioica]|uniref:Oidioi.mRNA.OKI2018_I69.XSR.g13928.t1.cds n=1 Tax=Oikopleura dioica TaxID=34765 RepID=A0ABN7SA25_OIKDI|nr:Oidioi.mRNA.OKI2018_I69.XSR.g13928.t1.cds [Oikopleura dioica]